MIENIIYLLIVILVPIVPAYLLFKKLKSSAEATGPVSPIKEFTVKFGGAFAGYFPIFLLLYFKLPNKFSYQPDPVKDLWEISGNVTDANTHRPIQTSEGNLQVILEPTSKVTSGTFTLYLLSSLFHGKEKLDYRLQVEDNKGGYLSSNEINLDNFREQFKNSQEIHLPDSCLMLSRKTTIAADSAKIGDLNEIK